MTKSSQWLRKAQGLMSGMASNYNVSRLLLGQSFVIVAVLLSAKSAFGLSMSGLIDGSVVQPPHLTVIILAYGVMMFASSYVEEEQHFWYWATTAWFGLLGFQSVKNR